MATKQAFFHSSFDPNLGEYSEGCEFLHPEEREQNAEDALTETQYFGFSVPEASIHALTYLWHHPNLGVVTGGAMAFQGTKRQAVAAELFDMRNYMSDRILENGLSGFRMDNSYSVEMLEPGRKFRTSYSDTARKNSFEIEYTAASPPIVWTGNRHFEQLMKTEGELVLRGQRHEVRGYNIRDRSWGESRIENPIGIPPFTWMTGAFGDDLAFNCNAIDDPARGPIWKDHFELGDMPVLKGGWLWMDGQSAMLKSASKLTHYDRALMLPERFELKFEDTLGRSLEMTGEVVASCPFNAWMNLNAPICLVRWECNGRVGWGDGQEAQWTDFINACG